MKRKLLLILSLLFAMIGVMAFAAACTGESDDKNPSVAGEEVGEYYLDAGGKEYTLTLTDECAFTLKLEGDPVTGTYAPDGEALEFTAADQSTFSGTYFNGVVTLSYNSETYRFLRKVEYTVTFESNGGSAVSPLKVINGKGIAKPSDPKKGSDVFIGWYTDNAFRSPYRFGGPVTSDIKLYARFVTPIEPEFTVSFDLNGATGTAPSSVQTVGHRVFELPTLEWAGHTFVGWWVSHYGDAAKLTYQYHEHLLGSNTTLYAVWEGEAPAVSVEEDTVSWTPVSNSQATVVITKPDAPEGAQEILRKTTGGGESSIKHTLSKADAGEYVIEVTIGDKTGRAYYKNKALDKVSVFEVMNNTLLFNGVEHAESYLIEIQCGIEGHAAHLEPIEIAANKPLSYDFSACELRKDGSILFTVTAQAEGYLSSVSAPFNMRRELPAVTGITVDPATETLQWAATAGATSYEVTVKLGEKTLYSGTVEGTSLPLRYYDSGKLSITVAPKGRGWSSPAATAYSYDKATIAAPSNIHAVVETSKIDWDDVAGAKSYEVKIGNHSAVSVTVSEIEFTEVYRVSGQVDYPITVRAIADTGATDSPWSDSYNVRYGELGDTLTYRNGALSWDPVFGIKEYYLSINGGEETKYTGVSKIPVTFSSSGTYSFVLRAVYDEEGKEEDTIRCSVEVYELSFDSMGSEQTFGNRYIADGDSLDLPEGDELTLFGYDFAGWYTDPDSGDLYNDGVFHEQNSRKLYAHWTPKVFHITLNVGIFGVVTTEITNGVDATYGMRVQLPIPTPNDSIKGFTGWYYSPTGGDACTIADGVIVSYNQGNAITLYAHWVDVMAFTPVYKNGAIAGYTVAKSRDIVLSNTTDLTIPATYKGMPVTEVLDFTDCKQLEVIRIPDSIQYIKIITTESAFKGCEALRAIKIYNNADYTGDKYYFDVDGVLFYNNPQTGFRELRMYPVARAAESYEIPDGVQVLPGNCIWDVDELSEVIIPASVTLIETSAIGYTDTFATFSTARIKAITFKAAAAGQAEEKLDIHAEAFFNLTKLEELTLPSRMKENLNFYAIFGGEEFDPHSLKSLSIVGTGGKYSVADGMLIEDLGSNGKSLLFCPSSKTEFTVPTGVTRIGENAARGNVNITKITITSSVEYIGAYAFAGCTGVTSIEFNGKAGDIALTIADHAFYGVGGSSTDGTGVNSIVLPENLVSVGAHAFGGTNISEVTLNNSAKFAIGAFDTDGGVSSVSKLIVGNKVENINFVQIFGKTSKGTFTVEIAEDHPHYISETLSDGGHNLVYIKGANGEKAELAWFSSLPENFTLPDTVTRIAARTFKGYTGLKSITIPASVTEIGDEAFAVSDDANSDRNGMALATVTFQAAVGTRADLILGDRVFAGCTKLTSITFPEGTKKLGAVLFDGCTSLEELHLPASLESIAHGALGGGDLGGTDMLGLFGTLMNTFNNCCLKTITVADGGHYYKAVNDVLYQLRAEDGNYVESEVLYFAPHSETINITIPNTVKRIWNYAFYGAENLQNVSFSANTLAQMTDTDGNKVAGTLEIGAYAFGACEATMSVSLPEGTTKLGAYAFEGSALGSFTVPGTVTSIGSGCFQNCTRLSGLTFAQGTANLTLEDAVSNYSIFGGCTKLNTLELPARTVYIGSYAFYKVKLDALVIPANVTKIGEQAFDSSVIPTITFAKDSKLEEIGIAAFSNAKLTAITIPASVRVIKNRAFNEAKELESFVVEDNAALEMIADDPMTKASVFEGCTSLATVNFGANSKLRAFSEDLFNGCTALTSVTIPLSVEEIEESAFENSGIEQITFEEKAGEKSKLRYVAQAFSGCALTEFSFPETDAEISLAENVFTGCSHLESVHLSSKVYDLRGAFNDLTSIHEITVAEDNPSYEVDETQPFLKSKLNGDILLVFGKITGKLKIPENSVQIGASAFINAEMEEVFIPRTVMQIGDSAFKNCSNLTKVVFESGSGLLTIGKEAFSGCTLLADIDFTKTLQLHTFFTTTGGDSNAFKNCTSLETLDFRYTRLTEIPKSIVSGCTNLKELTLPRSVTSMQAKLSNTKIVSLDLSKTGISELPAEFLKGDTALKSIALPAIIETIGESAFEGCTALAEMDLRNFGALTEIGKNVFKGCTELASVKFPTSVKTLRHGCFEGCSGLTSIDLNGIETVEYAAFRSSGLTSVTLPGTVTLWVEQEWDDYYSKWDDVRASSKKTGTFSDCKALQEVIFTSSMTADTRLDEYMFEDCIGLKTLTFQNGCKVAVLPKYMFSGCTSLESVTLPASITQLGSSACYVFRNCNSLTTVDLSATSIETLNSNLFDGCTKLRTVKLPHGLTSLPSYSFLSGSKSIEEIVLPETLKKIPSGSFNGCTSLKTINLTHVTEIESNAFKDCTSLQTIDLSSVTTIGSSAFQNTGITSLTLSTAIGDSAFKDCAALETVTFAPGCTFKVLGANAFANCAKLATINNLPASLTEIGAGAFAGTAIGTFTISANVNKLGENVFKDCVKLKSVTIEKGLTEISESCFSGCTLLDTVSLPESVTTIGASAFYGCAALQTIDTAHVTAIGANAFKNCTALQSIDVSNVTEVGAGAFDGCTKLFENAENWEDGVFYLGNIVAAIDDAEIEKVNGEVIIRNGVESIGEKLFYGSAALKKITLPASVVSIGASAFENCTALTEIDFSAATGLTELPQRAFSGCAQLTTVALPDAITKIGSNCFLNSGIKDFTFTVKMGSIGASAFSGSALTSVTFAEPVGDEVTALTTLPDNLFKNCVSLANVTLSSKLTKFGTSSFEGCMALKQIDFTVCAQLTELPNQLFKGCTLLADVTLPAKLTKIGTSSFEGCTALKQIDFTVCTQLTELPDAMFKGCTLLADVTLPAKLTKIGANCFEGTAVAFAELPETVSAIGTGAFKGCEKITSFTFPKALKNFGGRGSSWTDGLGTNVFENCTGLVTVTVPDDIVLTQLSNYTFKGCTSLKKVRISTKITRLGTNPFEGCTLELLELPGTASIAPYVSCFSSVKAIKTISIIDAADPEQTEINSEFKGIVGVKGLEKIVIAASVKAINSSAFSNLPASVTLCFRATEEEMKKTFTGGEAKWNAFKESLPENAQVVYGYQDAPAAEEEADKN